MRLKKCKFNFLLRRWLRCGLESRGWNSFIFYSVYWNILYQIMEALAYISPNLKFEFDYRITTTSLVVTYNGLVGKSKKKIRLSNSVCQKNWLRLWSFWRQIWKRKVSEVDNAQCSAVPHFSPMLVAQLSCQILLDLAWCKVGKNSFWIAMLSSIAVFHRTSSMNRYIDEEPKYSHEKLHLLTAFCLPWQTVITVMKFFCQNISAPCQCI